MGQINWIAFFFGVVVNILVLNVLLNHDVSVWVSVAVGGLSGVVGYTLVFIGSEFIKQKK